MRLALILALAGWSTAAAQSVANPNRIRSLIARMESGAGSQPLACDVTPIKPALNFSFRYQAGYSVSVPMKQYFGSGHSWTTLIQITPQAEGKRPVYLVSQASLPNIPKTNVESRSGGAYLLGEGAYDVRWMLVDNSNRVCRKSWRVEVRRARSESKVRVSMPADTVWEIGLRGSRQLPTATDDAAPMRLTIFLHTAPMFARRTRMRGNDQITLLSTVSALLERLPAKYVRLVLFNLDKQKELYRKDDFQLRDMYQVYESMSNIELGLVDYQVLQNRMGHVDLLSDLVNRELAEAQQSDLVLFLGPTTRFLDRMPNELVEKPAGLGPHFYYFQLVPGPFQQDAMLTDSIKSTLSRVGGKTLVIHNPGEFAKAIERVEKLPRIAAQGMTGGGQR